jgi:hypothetical protein
MKSKTTRYSWLIAVLAASNGCDTKAPPGLLVNDSAGIRITINRDRASSFAQVSSTPRLSLGGENNQGPTQFFRIQNIYVDVNRRVWIADGQSRELRIFGPDGSHLVSRGGRGAGPGEFAAIRLLGGRSGDSVFVADDANGRLSVYSPEGDFVRTQQILFDDHPTPRLFKVFADGSVLGQVPRILMASATRAGQVLGDSANLVRVNPELRQWRPYGSAMGPRWIWTGRGQVPVPFTANAAFDVLGDYVHLVSGSTFQIRVFREGRLLEIYRIDRPSRGVSDADVAAYAKFTETYIPKGQQAEYLAALDNAARPQELPAFARLIVSTDSHVWAQRYQVDPSAAQWWDVFDVGRRLVGQVETPPNFVVTHIAADQIVGVWRDDVGVEYVRSYSLLKR